MLRSPPQHVGEIPRNRLPAFRAFPRVADIHDVDPFSFLCAQPPPEMQRDELAFLPPFTGIRVADPCEFAQGDQSCRFVRERTAGNAAD